MDPDRQAQDVDPDLAKWCRYEQVRIQNSAGLKVLRDVQGTVYTPFRSPDTVLAGLATGSSWIVDKQLPGQNNEHNSITFLYISQKSNQSTNRFKAKPTNITNIGEKFEFSYFPTAGCILKGGRWKRNWSHFTYYIHHSLTKQILLSSESKKRKVGCFYCCI